MKRNYTSGVVDNVEFFTGVEIEHTPAYGKPTLFVTGVQPVGKIARLLEDKTHIFFGANHSFSPDVDCNWKAWTDMILHFLNKDIWCSLDIPVRLAEDFLEVGLTEYNKFIPQIRLPLPYIQQWNYNTMIKLDDKDFNATNPGVWTHNLHNLMNRECFTSWDQYNGDNIVK